MELRVKRVIQNMEEDVQDECVLTTFDKEVISEYERD